jgi:hypothetical protein
MKQLADSVNEIHSSFSKIPVVKILYDFRIECREKSEMVITDDFVFIHLPKTGGTFVEQMLERLYRSKNRNNFYYRALQKIGHVKTTSTFINVNKHGACSDIPEAHRSKKIIATIRNPYDRYVSQYEFNWWKECLPVNPDRVSKHYPQYPDLSFEAFIDFFNEMIRLLPSAVNHSLYRTEFQIGYHTEQFVKQFFRNPDRVFLRIDETYIQNGMYRKDMFDVTFIDMDFLNQDLCNFLVSIGHRPRELEFITKAEKIFPPRGGRSGSKKWREYYTPELKKKVRLRERFLFELFPQFDVE